MSHICVPAESGFPVGRLRSLRNAIRSPFGDQLGPFPDPAYLMEPATHGFRCDRDAVFGLERRSEGGTTPQCAAPAIGTWGFFEYGAQRAREPGH